MSFYLDVSYKQSNGSNTLSNSLVIASNGIRTLNTYFFNYVI